MMIRKLMDEGQYIHFQVFFFLAGIHFQVEQQDLATENCQVTKDPLAQIKRDIND